VPIVQAPSPTRTSRNNSLTGINIILKRQIQKMTNWFCYTCSSITVDPIIIFQSYVCFILSYVCFFALIISFPVPVLFNTIVVGDVEVTRQFLATNKRIINRGDSFKRRDGRTLPATPEHKQRQNTGTEPFQLHLNINRGRIQVQNPSSYTWT
jgi:hypothetical protein